MWNGVKKFFSKWAGVFGMAGGLINGIINHDWSLLQAQATSLVTGFVTGGPIGALTAVATTSFMSLPPAQQLTRFMANEVYDDIFGFSPRTAYIIAYIDVSMATSMAFESAFANIMADPGVVKDFDINNPKHRDLIKNEKYGYNTYGGPPDPTNPEAVANWVAAGKVKVIEGANGNMALVGSRPYALGSVHTGANSPNFPKALNMKYPSNLPRNLQGFTFGWCHQASNATLLKAGFSNIVTDIFPNYFTYATTFVYGNYGGGLVQKAYSGYQAYNNWEKGRQ